MGDSPTSKEFVSGRNEKNKSIFVIFLIYATPATHKEEFCTTLKEKKRKEKRNAFSVLSNFVL